MREGRYRDWFWIFVFGNLNAMLFFLPVLFELGGRTKNPFLMIYRAFFHTEEIEVLIGDGVDPLGSFWIVSKVRHMLTGQSETVLKELYAPKGFDIALHEGYAWADTLFAMPWELLIGSPGFYNIHVYQTLLLSFIACTALFRAAGLPLFYALILSNVALLHPFGVGEVAYGRPTQMNWVFLCCFLIGILKLQKGHRFAFWTIWTGVSLGVSCLVYWFGGAAVGLCGAIAYFFHCLRDWRKWKAWLAGLGVALIACGLTLAVTWRVSKPILMGKANDAYKNISQTSSFDIDLGLFTIPIRRVNSLDDWSKIVELFVLSSIPFIVAALGMVTFLSRGVWKKHWPWLIAGLIAIGIPLDYGIDIAGSTIPTGYSLLQIVFPPIVRCLFAERLMVAPTLVLLLIFSLSFSLNFRDSKYYRWLFLGILFMNLSHIPLKNDMFTIQFQPSKALISLQGGLIEVPFEKTNESYVQQLWHEEQIIGGPGIMMLRGKAHQRYFSNNKLLMSLEKMSQGEHQNIATFGKRDILQLRKDGFRYVVLYLNEIEGKPDRFKHHLGQKPIVFEDEKIWAFDLKKVKIP